MPKQVMITLRQIRDNYPPAKLWKKLLKVKGSTEVGFDKPFPLSEILDVGGLEDTIGCFYSLPEYRKVFVKFALFCAKSANMCTLNQHVRTCIAKTEGYIAGTVNRDEVVTATNDAHSYTCTGATAAVQVARYVLTSLQGTASPVYPTTIVYAASVAADVAYATRRDIQEVHAYDRPVLNFNVLSDAHTARSREVQKQVDYLRTLLDGEVYRKPEIHKLHLKSWLWSLITKPFEKWKNKA